MQMFKFFLDRKISRYSCNLKIFEMVTTSRLLFCWPQNMVATWCCINCDTCQTVKKCLAKIYLKEIVFSHFLKEFRPNNFAKSNNIAFFKNSTFSNYVPTSTYFNRHLISSQFWVTMSKVKSNEWLFSQV